MKPSTCLATAAASVFLQLAGATAVVDTAASSAAKCCGIIETAFPKKTYSSGNQRNLYQQFVNSYFSVNDRLTPSCAVSPANTQDVAAVVGLLAKSSCQFAVKSGGHGILTASSNIAKGVTIDLRAMRSVSLNKKTKTAIVQPGAKWIEVYKYLDALGFAIPGGRAGDVGVGGLTTGGGNSFFAARYGFVCDNVKNFEVVLGCGKVVHANNVTNPDLFTALKGGSNNLGIVTKFEIVAFEQSDLWGGTAQYDAKTIPAQLEAFYDFTENLVKDPYGSLIFVWLYFPAIKSLVIENLYEYTANLSGPVTTYPPPFKGFAPDSPVGPPISNTLRVTNLSSLTGELNSAANLSNLYATLTFTNKLPVLQEVVKIINREFDVYKKNAFYEYASVEFQPLPRLFTDHSLARGGNVLGLDRYHDNNIIFLLDMAWNGTQYDAQIRSLADNVMGNLTTYLKGVGELKDFQYLNYAFQDQDPLGGYGKAALSKIKAASKKYDPGQVFQKLVPGGWKLATAGTGNKYTH
ncbi:MAG: hypothetical protein HETSPECPRED_009436 [Heterodermia speciosa]|uniref:FAD-binding PCMH-type domain-containing protein n=1 Tax=Heterodermia speciosa TaxID=116794 RepID=A0A8H3G3B5_9LECA|nr:MAG: hypothetical protein HETSPECPRED_009436 [Heterodermia speciosa]